MLNLPTDRSFFSTDWICNRKEKSGKGKKVSRSKLGLLLSLRRAGGKMAPMIRLAEDDFLDDIYDHLDVWQPLDPAYIYKMPSWSVIRRLFSVRNWGHAIG